MEGYLSGVSMLASVVGSGNELSYIKARVYSGSQNNIRSIRHNGKSDQSLLGRRYGYANGTYC